VVSGVAVGDGITVASAHCSLEPSRPEGTCRFPPTKGDSDSIKGSDPSLVSEGRPSERFTLGG
jgi:hypothetical protein